MFISKKQKKLIRERRKKKKAVSDKTTSEPLIHNNKDENPSVIKAVNVDNHPAKPESRKRPYPIQEPVIVVPVEEALEKIKKIGVRKNTVIVIPSHLDAKEARKFRKEERRKARAEGRDDTQLQFVVEGTPESNGPSAAKKRKKEFPSIKKLLEEEQNQKRLQQDEEARQKAEDSLSEEYKAKFVALDCEMVGIGSEGRQSVLARVSMTNWQGDVLLDTWVKVPSRVTDFRTKYSGATPSRIKGDDAMDPTECREKVASILKGKILVGHALKNDLDALMLTHPKPDIRDTAKYRPFQRYGGNKWRPRKLRDLAKEQLSMVIQQEGDSHDSVDDARAAMELYKRMHVEWEQALQHPKSEKK